MQPADEAHVGVGVHVKLDVEQFAQFGLGEDQDALDQDHGRWLHAAGLLRARVGGEVVGRDFDGSAGTQFFQMFGQQFGLQ